MHMTKSVRVFVVTAVARAIPFEILDEGRGAGSNVTKVDSFAARSQQEQPIKDVEKFSGGLYQSISACVYVQESSTVANLMDAEWKCR